MTIKFTTDELLDQIKESSNLNYDRISKYNDLTVNMLHELNNLNSRKYSQFVKIWKEINE